MAEVTVRFQSACLAVFCLLLAVPATPASVITTPATTAPQTYFQFNSSPTSWIGQGGGGTLGITHVQRNLDNSIEFTTAGGWQITFAGPNSTLPTIGDHPNATRWPSNGSNPGFDFSGNNRGDNNLTGQYTLLDFTFDPLGYVGTFAADFTQYDEGVTSAWNVGSIRYNYTAPIPEPTLLAPLAVATVLLHARRRRCRRSAM